MVTKYVPRRCKQFFPMLDSCNAFSISCKMCHITSLFQHAHNLNTRTTGQQRTHLKLQRKVSSRTRMPQRQCILWKRGLGR